MTDNKSSKQTSEQSLEELVEDFLEQTLHNKELNIEEFIATAPELHQSQLRELLPLIVDLNDVASDTARKISTIDDAIPQLPTNDFSITKKIGSGGMGTVYEGIQHSLNRKVAIKILSPHLITDAAHRKSFENEAQIIAMLHHPNIIKVLHAASNTHCCYYVMELIEGKPLNKRCFNDLRDIAKIGLQIAQALTYAHSCGIMHRDIKPTNIIIDSNDNIHIGDFGLAYIFNNSKNELPNTSEISEDRSGTIRYMSPERLTKGTNSFVNDQYALGITLYELITKAPVIEAKSRKEMIEKLSTKPIPQLHCNEPDLAAIINKCISFRPEDRYSAMIDLADDLHRFLCFEPVKAQPKSFFKSFKLWAKRNPTVATLSAVLTTFAIGLCISLFAGYYTTSKALERAEKSSTVADSTLSHVFDHISTLSPSEKNTELLSTLLPYYQIIVKQENLSPEKLEDANLILASTAMRVGKYDLAMEAYQRLLETGMESPMILNQLAISLAMQDKVHEARQIWSLVIEKYSDSDEEEDQSEVVRALLSLSEAPDSNERRLAFAIIEKLLKRSPQNPEYLFQYAQILSEDPNNNKKYLIDGKEQNPVEILLKLANQYPGNREYGIALLELQKGHHPIGFGERFPRVKRQAINRVNKKGERSQNNPQRSHKFFNYSNSIYELSERMLWLWPNDAEVINAVITYQLETINAHRSKSDYMNRFVVDRLIHLLEMLYYNPETSTSTKEILINLQLQQLAIISTNTNRDKYIQEIQLKKIERELQLYDGQKKTEFENQLNKLKDLTKQE